jgi:acetoin utilization protein AcuC
MPGAAQAASSVRAVGSEGGRAVDGLRLIWDEAFTRYDFGPSHPLAPVRLELTTRLCDEFGLLHRPGVRVVGAEPATDEVLTTVHTAEYVEAVRVASEPPYAPALRWGLGTDDVPVFPGMHDPSARVAEGTRDVALAVWTGEAEHGLNYTGGLHHAMPSSASGFCVYNDVAIGIKALLDAGARRVGYVDVDVHHGDGVERVFWDDDRVLTISLHETGRVLFPGTGFPQDSGGPKAEGMAANVAFPPGTGDAGWLRAFHAIVPPLLEAFEPEVLVSQHGCDSHALDPLAHMALSLDAQRASYEAVHELAHRVCGGRWVATGGGGYEIVQVVPRAWTHLVGIAAHAPVDPATTTPGPWQEYVHARMGRPAPVHMTDGRSADYRSWATGYDPDDPVDRAVMATRRAVFPAHGLDPWSI